MGDSSIVGSLAVLLGAALVGGVLAHRLRQPVILGYLLIGAAVGPHALGLVSDQTVAEGAATVGVALLMFTLGLEVSIGQLRQVGRVGLWGGIAQIVLTSAIGVGAGVGLFHWSVEQATIFGLGISLSSTLVCLKILMERGELDSAHGRIMLAILILQDISVVLMIVAETLLTHPDQNLFLALAITAGKAAAFVLVAVALGLWVLPWLLGSVGGVRSRELFLLTVIVLCLGAALGTTILGLSVVFGAFVIGLVLRESKFASQALAEITPLRDVFASLFFVSLGMLLDPRFVVDHWPLVLAALGVVIFIKVVVVYGVVRLFGYNSRIAVLCSSGLFQIGEFSFILAQTGIAAGIVTDEFYSLMVASAIITMLLTPLSISLVSRIYPQLVLSFPGGGRGDGTGSAPVATEPSQPAGTVLIAGYGRVGQSIADGLQQAGIPYAVVEIDPEVVDGLRCDQETCHYGDASNIHVLSRLDMKSVKTLVVTYPDPIAARATISAALKVKPGLRIVARAHRDQDAAALRALAPAVEIIRPEYEAGMAFLRLVTEAEGQGEAG